jgi:hypothetical protein
MKKLILIGAMTLATACASTTQRVAKNEYGPQRWEGYVLRNGLQVPVDVEFARASAHWTGQLLVGDEVIPLRQVRLTGLGVHFEIPGEAFDGTVAGDWMAGSVSGAKAPGSFTLMRDAQPEPPDDREYDDYFRP